MARLLLIRVYLRSSAADSFCVTPATGGTEGKRRRAFSLAIGLGRNDPEAVVLGVFVDYAEVALLFLLLLLVGARLHARKCDPLAFRRDTIRADLALPIGEHLSLAAIHRDAPQVRLAAALRGEVHVTRSEEHTSEL